MRKLKEREVDMIIETVTNIVNKVCVYGVAIVLFRLTVLNENFSESMRMGCLILFVLAIGFISIHIKLNKIYRKLLKKNY